MVVKALYWHKLDKWNPYTRCNYFTHHLHNAARIPTVWEIIFKIERGFFDKCRNNKNTIYNLRWHAKESMWYSGQLLSNFILLEDIPKIKRKLFRHSHYTCIYICTPIKIRVVLFDPKPYSIINWINIYNTLIYV